MNIVFCGLFWYGFWNREMLKQNCDTNFLFIHSSESIILFLLAAYNTSKFDVNSLHGGNSKKEKQLLPDDGKGKVKVRKVLSSFVRVFWGVLR